MARCLGVTAPKTCEPSSCDGSIPCARSTRSLAVASSFSVFVSPERMYWSRWASIGRCMSTSTSSCPPFAVELNSAICSARPNPGCVLSERGGSSTPLRASHRPSSRLAGRGARLERLRRRRLRSGGVAAPPTTGTSAGSAAIWMICLTRSSRCAPRS